MNVELPEVEKMKKRTIIIYTFAGIACILAIIVIVGVLILGDDFVNNLFLVDKIINKTEQQEAELKADFFNLFQNNFINKNNYDITKQDNEEEIIYSCYQKAEKNDDYEIEVNIPRINIKNNQIYNINKEIEEMFQRQSEEIINKENEKAFYTVKYTANIERNILSLMIYAELKENTNAQRTIVKTYNFNLENNKVLNLRDFLKIYNLNEKTIEQKINKNISEEEQKAQELRQLGYNIFSRDINSNIYKVQNTNEFFVKDNNLYIIYPYGNENNTSEMDLVII